MKVGIDKLAVWPSTMAIDMRTLVEDRGASTQLVCDQMMIRERSVNPPWEDPVTMAVNAGRLLLEGARRDRIKLLIVATESGLDQEKSLSTWVQRYLELPDDCRNVELKHACYGGTAALQLASAWLLSQRAGVQALVITTDQSRMHFHKPYEFVMGASAAAMLVSRQPEFLELEPGLSGVYTQEVSDLTRPTSRIEAGHSETSLLSYLDAVDICFERYLDAAEANGLARPTSRDALAAWMPYHIYHAPFGGITERAHRALMRSLGAPTGKELRPDFEARVAPTLRHNRRMGGTYASSVFISMLGLVDSFGAAAVGQRVGVYSYGSGSCAEFYSARFGGGAAEVARAADLEGLLNQRKMLSVGGYEDAERERSCWIDCGDYRISLAGYEGWYDARYRGQRLLTFRGVTDFVRQYEWS
jgi:3-hydroxy-3-methylglutaryl CoA synthase